MEERLAVADAGACGGPSGACVIYGAMLPPAGHGVPVDWKDYSPLPPDDSSVSTDWMVCYPAPCGTGPPMTVDLIRSVDHRIPCSGL